MGEIVLCPILKVSTIHTGGLKPQNTQYGCGNFYHNQPEMGDCGLMDLWVSTRVDHPDCLATATLVPSTRLDI